MQTPERHDDDVRSDCESAHSSDATRAREPLCPEFIAIDRQVSGVESLTGNDRLGETALHSAVRRTDRDRVAALLASGADPNVTDAVGRTPSDLAREILARWRALDRANLLADMDDALDQAFGINVAKDTDANGTTHCMPGSDNGVDPFAREEYISQRLKDAEAILALLAGKQPIEVPTFEG